MTEQFPPTVKNKFFYITDYSQLDRNIRLPEPLKHQKPVYSAPSLWMQGAHRTKWNLMVLLLEFPSFWLHKGKKENPKEECRLDIPAFAPTSQQNRGQSWTELSCRLLMVADTFCGSAICSRWQNPFWWENRLAEAHSTSNLARTLCPSLLIFVLSRQ